MSEWFDSAFQDWLDDHDVDREEVGKARIADMKAAFYAGASQGIEYALVCVRQETSE